MPIDAARLDAFLADPEVPKADKDRVVALVRAERAPQEGRVASFLRTTPRLVGAIKGGEKGMQLGSRFGRVGGFAGALGGAALGALTGEGAQIATERAGEVLEGEPTRAEPTGSRLLAAAKEGPVIEIGGQAAGLAGRGVSSMLGRLAGRGASFEGITQAGVAGTLSRELEKGGGALDATTFARTARKSLRAMLRDTERQYAAKGASKATRQALEPQLSSLRQLVHRTASLAPVADAVAKDPVLLADLLRQGGPTLLPELQSSWLTAAISSATGRAGLARGTLNVPKLLAHFDELGVEGQRALFGTRAPVLRRAFDAIADTVPPAAAAAKGAAGSRVLNAAQMLLGGAGLAEMASGHVARGLGIGATPLLIGRILARNGGAEWLTSVATAMRDARLFREAAPALARAGTQLLAQQATPAAPRLGFAAAGGQ